MTTIASYAQVREITRTAGTGSIKLEGPEPGYQALGAVGHGNACDYCVTERGGKEWKIGRGTYTAAPPTLAAL